MQGKAERLLRRVRRVFDGLRVNGWMMVSAVGPVREAVAAIVRRVDDERRRPTLASMVEALALYRALPKRVRSMVEAGDDSRALWDDAEKLAAWRKVQALMRGVVWVGADVQRQHGPGFLVTRQEPALSPVAWVPGVDDEAFALANRIAADSTLAGVDDGGGVVDLRGCGVREGQRALPEWFGRVFLLKLTPNGKLAGPRPDGWTCGMFQRLIHGRRRSLSFTHWPGGMLSENTIDVFPPRWAELIRRTRGDANAKQGPDSWTLWRVVKGDVGCIGHLVTEAGRVPRPLAFVEFDTDRRFRLALSIRDGRGVWPRSVTDLRDRNLSAASGRRALPAFLYDALLLPVDSSGRVLDTDSTFGGGQYMRPQRIGSEVFAFRVFTHAGMETGYASAVCGRRPGAKQKQPRSAKPQASKPDRAESKRAAGFATA